MSGELWLLPSLLAQWLLGVGAAGAIFSASRQVSRQASRVDQSEPVALTFTELAGLGWVLGIGLSAWLLFVWSYCGGSLGRESSVILSVLGILSGGPVLIRWWRRSGSIELNRAGEEIEQRREAAWCRSCQVLIGGLVVLALIQTLMTPHRFWDERSIFAIKGLVLFEDGTVHSRDLANADFVQYHPRYPLLIPLAELHIYCVLGRVDDRWAKVLFPLLYGGMLLTLAGALSRRVCSGLAWLAALLVATIPVLMPYELGFLSGQADAVVACFHGVSVLYVWDTWQSFQRSGKSSVAFEPMVLAGLCGGLAAFAKDEGLAFLMVDVAAAGLLIVCGGRRAPMTLRLLAFIGCSALILFPWFRHRSALPTTTEMSYFERASLSLLTERWHVFAWEAQHLANRMWWEWRFWGLHWWLLAIALLFSIRRAMTSSQLFLLLDILGGLMALMVAGMLAPAQLDEHIGGSSARFLMQLSPVAVMFAVGQIATLQSTAANSCDNQTMSSMSE